MSNPGTTSKNWNEGYSSPDPEHARKQEGTFSATIHNCLRCGCSLDGYTSADSICPACKPYVLPPETDPDPRQPEMVSFQDRVEPWMQECFGPEISSDRTERNHRFLEEALELVQACGASQNEAHQLVDYVYGRETGKAEQEVGGVMVTLAALCLANDLNMHCCGETELKRVWGKIETIRAKQAAKPKNSPLPEGKL